MSRSTPFLIGKGAGDGVVATRFGLGERAKISVAPDAPIAAEQAVVTVVFRNSRREGFSMDIDTSEELLRLPDAKWITLRQIRRRNQFGEETKIRNRRSAQFVQVDLGIPCFAGFQRLFPSDFAARIRSGARHHAGKCGLRAF